MQWRGSAGQVASGRMEGARDTCYSLWSVELLQKAKAHGFDAVIDKPCKDSVVNAIRDATMGRAGAPGEGKV